MNGGFATLVSGCAAYSLGEAWALEYRRRMPDKRVIAVDRENSSALHDDVGIRTVEFDLNPLVPGPKYEEFCDKLTDAVSEAHSETATLGISTAILGAGVYESGELIETSAAQRARILGVNVCGNLELLCSTMAINRRMGVDNAAQLTLIEVGSLHGLTSPEGRSVYGASKAFALELCISLRAGRELKRAVYVALGPVDTAMLHRNHWVTKEQGSLDFYLFVKDKRPHLYRDVFVRLDNQAFNEAASSANMLSDELSETFHRYRERRQTAFEEPVGVLDPMEIAAPLVEIAIDDENQSDGVVVFTAPLGKIRTEKCEFSDFVRWPL